MSNKISFQCEACAKMAIKCTLDAYHLIWYYVLQNIIYLVRRVCNIYYLRYKGEFISELNNTTKHDDHVSSTLIRSREILKYITCYASNQVNHE